MHSIILVLAVAATPQVKDLLVYGNNTYFLNEVPMLGLWDYGDGPPAPGRQKPPKFDSAGSANWVGCEATWLIRDSKLYLRTIRARREGKRIRNEQIMSGHKFPLVATWFSGRIHLAVGGFDHSIDKYRSVVIFHVEQGTIRKTTFESLLDYRSFKWNGMPSDSPD